MDVQLAISKTNKFASRESGDTVEVVERPQGGFSVVMADGQGSGASAKTISHLVTTMAIGMIKEGARDGVTARATSDHLYASRAGRVSATLVIVSVDLVTRTLVLTRNSHCPILLLREDTAEPKLLQEESSPIGVHTRTRPNIIELPLAPGMSLLTFTDGFMEAGKRDNRHIEVTALFQDALSNGLTNARQIADYLLERALAAEANRPADDISVLVLTTHPQDEQEPARIVPQIKQLDMRIPI